MKKLGAMLILLTLFGCGLNGDRGTGEKIGQIVKLSKQGVIVSTWEGQLIRGGMNGGSGSFGTVPFDFTVDDEAMVPKLREYMEKQTEIVIHYRTEGVYAAWRSDSSGHFLVSAEPAREGEE